MMNYEYFSKIFDDKNDSFRFIVEQEMIDCTKVCPICEDPEGMYLVKHVQSKTGYMWKCDMCSKSTTLLRGSIFGNSRLSIGKVLKIIYFWANDYSNTITSHETNISEHTISSIFHQLKNCCYQTINCDEFPKIGGPDDIVEIDETMFSRRKNHCGRILNAQWIFGGISRNNNLIFLEEVPDRKANTLFQYITKNIEYGTLIISDMWAGYNIIDKQPHPQPYPHQYVNHSENFIDPITGANTQKCERMWREFKEKKKRYQGIPRKDVDLYTAEFKWRNKIKIENSNPFLAACKMLSQIQFE